MKTFIETIKPETAPKTESLKIKSIPTFKDMLNPPVVEEEQKSCMSEDTEKKIQECMEAMKNEMKSCHEDETENTAAMYMKECEDMMTKMQESLKSHCDECMK